jgi:hypothetical protein
MSQPLFFSDDDDDNSLIDYNPSYQDNVKSAAAVATAAIEDAEDDADLTTGNNTKSTTTSTSDTLKKKKKGRGRPATFHPGVLATVLPMEIVLEYGVNKEKSVKDCGDNQHHLITRVMTNAGMFYDHDYNRLVNKLLPGVPAADQISGKLKQALDLTAEPCPLSGEALRVELACRTAFMNKDFRRVSLSVVLMIYTVLTSFQQITSALASARGDRRTAFDKKIAAKTIAMRQVLGAAPCTLDLIWFFSGQPEGWASGRPQQQWAKDHDGKMPTNVNEIYEAAKVYFTKHIPAKDRLRITNERIAIKLQAKNNNARIRKSMADFEGGQNIDPADRLAYILSYLILTQTLTYLQKL